MKFQGSIRFHGLSPIRNISYLLQMCCSFWEKCINSPKKWSGVQYPLKHLRPPKLMHIWREFLNWIHPPMQETKMISSHNTIYTGTEMTSFDWFQTRQPRHESDDRTGDAVTSVCEWERWGTLAANLINICHCIVAQ